MANAICLACGTERNWSPSTGEKLSIHRCANCGGSLRKLPLKHGGVGTLEYGCWRDMNQRCTDPNHGSYSRYGGRGIRVCDRWRDFAAFRADMGPRPSPKHSIDRINVDGHYEPGNCHWVTHHEQSRNTSRTRLIKFNGEEMCIADWALRLGMKYQTLLNRLSRMPPEEALTKPVANTGARVYKREPPMQPDVTPTEHLAGPMVDLVQRCTRCSEILMDYRGPGAEEMVRQRGPENPPRGWQEGAGVVLHGHRSDPPGARLRGTLAEVYEGDEDDGGPAVKCTGAASAA